ncbi:MULTISPECIES: hypothetical protein [Ramlibacter]|uniref:Uncharacterized protein n=1 Tax=Ramlibacter rhizophilus TaxID=1781167 RepID=A0A4Z0BGN5_9BURK|nr:hypothetical protein [Ramlibacter rhizophilus]TFY98475.1 hypothetical protein EZ242_13095 [Ramlibacter rhizophilus]
MSWLKIQIAAAPKLALLAGQSLFALGGFLIVSGLIGRVTTTAINSSRSLSKLPALTGLREAFPTYALWWVPESLLGYALPGLLAIGGIYVGQPAKQLLQARRTALNKRRR